MAFEKMFDLAVTLALSLVWRGIVFDCWRSLTRTTSHPMIFWTSHIKQFVCVFGWILDYDNLLRINGFRMQGHWEVSFSLSKLLRVKLYSDMLILFDSISLVCGACDNRFLSRVWCMRHVKYTSRFCKLIGGIESKSARHLLSLFSR